MWIGAKVGFERLEELSSLVYFQKALYWERPNRRMWVWPFLQPRLKELIRNTRHANKHNATSAQDNSVSGFHKKFSNQTHKTTMFAPESAASTKFHTSMPLFEMPLERNPFAPGFASSDSEGETSFASSSTSGAFDQWQQWAEKNQRQQRRKFFPRKTQKHNLLGDDVDEQVERFMQMATTITTLKSSSLFH